MDQDIIPSMEDRLLRHFRPEAEPRRDVLQKKIHSKMAHFIYKYVFKTRRQISKVEAQARMKAYYGLNGNIMLPYPYQSTRDQIFERLFGREIKNGMHNDVVRMILTNERLYNTFVNQAFLLDFLSQLEIQTRNEIRELPWSRLMYTRALIVFLERLQIRARREHLIDQYDEITELISFFNGLVRNHIDAN